MQHSVEYYFSQLNKEMSCDSYYKEISRAKDEFLDNTGIIHTDDSFYEMKMAVFWDWFLFDRPLQNGNRTYDSPLVYYYKSRDSCIPQKEIEVYSKFSENIHSLFVVKKFKKNELVVKDLYSKKKYVCQDINFTFNKGQVIEARIIPFNGHFTTTGAYLFHPEEILSFIKKRIKLLQKSKEPLLPFIHKLAYCHSKSLQYRHIQSQSIYQQEFM